MGIKDKEDIPSIVLRNIIEDNVSQINKMFEHALKLKGFLFSDRLELEEFVKERCTAKDDRILREKIFYYDNKPFLIYNYSNSNKIDIVEDEGSIKVSSEIGYFIFV